MNLDVLPELPKGEETEWKKGIAETSPPLRLPRGRVDSGTPGLPVCKGFF